MLTLNAFSFLAAVWAGASVCANQQHWNRSAEVIKQAVVDDLMRHIDTQKVYDDITLL